MPSPAPLKKSVFQNTMQISAFLPGIRSSLMPFHKPDITSTTGHRSLLYTPSSAKLHRGENKIPTLPPHV